jgi:hypothetical protein
MSPYQFIYFQDAGLRIAHNVEGLAIGWKFVSSSPEPEPNIVTEDEDNN